MADGLNNHEQAALDALGALLAKDAGLGRDVAALPWVVDGITEQEGKGLGDLQILGKENIALTRELLGFPWVADDITDDEWRTLANLRRIAQKDAFLAGTLSGFPWIHDNITEPERWVVRYLRDLATVDPAVAKTVFNYPWVADAISEDERWALRNIVGLTLLDVSLGKMAAALTWLADEITEDERWALRYIRDVAELDRSLGKTLIGFPWVVDDISEDERWALRTLDNLATEDPLLANQLVGMPFLTASFEQHDRYALRSLLNLYFNYTDEYQILTTQGWFTDGLDDLEASFVMVFGTADSQLTPRDLRDLIVTRHSESRTIDLPLAGQIQLTFFEPTDDPQNRKIVQQIEDAIREIESFINVPFPMEEVTLLFASPGESAFSENKVLGLNRGTHLVVDPGLARQGDTNRTIVHEIGHYYWSGASKDNPLHGVPLWFQEGGADFLASYVRDRLFDDPLSTSKRTLEQRNIRNCAVRGINDLQRLIDKLAESGYSEHSASPFFICNYHYGEALFLNLFETLGEEAFRHAWTEIYRLTQSEARPISEIEIYQAFRNNIPPDKLADLNSVYQRWHGGEIPE